MADEELTGAEPADEVVVEEEGIPEAQTDEAPDPVATLAGEMGWVPKDQYKGDADNWRDPATFIRAGKDIQRNLARDLKDMRSTVDNMARTSTTLFEQQMKAEREKLEDRWYAAVDEGDHQKAFELQREFEAVSQPVKPQAPPEVSDFASRHSAWFQKDPLATQRAIEVSSTLARAGYDTAAQLEGAERAVRKEFPEHFAQPAKPQPRVGQPQRTGTTSSKRGFADMPAAAQKVARDMVDRGVIPNTDIYATNYFADERKVG